MKAKLLIPFLVLLAACNTVNKPMTDEQKAAVKEEGSVIVKEIFDAMITSNGEKMIGLMENSPDFIFIVAGEIYSNEKMKEMVKQFMPLIERQTFETKFEQYVIVDPSCFIYTWQGKNGGYMKTGDSTIMDDYIATYAFRKTEGSWKLFFGHESSKVPFPIDTTKVE
jgi:hypothetical protein